MKKYLFIYKSEIMSSLQYIANNLLNFLGYFMHIFIFFNLWDYIYSNPEELINGYSKCQMIWYIVITEVIWVVVGGRKLCRLISDDVKSGNISYNMNKPYSYVGYRLFSHLGEGTIKFFIFIVLGGMVGYLFLGEIPNLNIIQLVIVVILLILAITIQTLCSILIGLLSFIIEDSNPLHWVYGKAVLILGTIFPIEFFPTAVQKIAKLSPIYVVSYGPAKLFVDFEIKTALNILVAQIIYLFIVYKLCMLMYNKGVKRINVNGG